MHCCRLLLLFTLVLIQSRVWAELPPVPPIESHFTAHGKQFSAQQEKTLDKALESIQSESKVDFAVLVLDQPLPSDQYDSLCQQVFRTWNIGKSWDGGGILMLVSPDGRQCVTTQSEEEHPLSKALATNLRKTVESAASSGQLYRGLLLAIERCRRILRSGENRPVQRNSLKRAPDRAANYGFGAVLVLIAAAICSKKVPR